MKRSLFHAALGCTLLTPALLSLSAEAAPATAPAASPATTPATTLPRVGMSTVGNTVTFKPSEGVASVRVQVKAQDGTALYDSGWMMGFDAGLEAVTWQALDDKGNPLPAGVYPTSVEVRGVDGTTRAESGSLQLEAPPVTTRSEVSPRATTITGAGTANRLALWTSASTIGDSIIVQTNASTLTVAGTLNIKVVNATNPGGNALVGNSNSGTALAGISKTGNGVLGSSTTANAIRGVTGTGVGVRGDSNNGTLGVQGNSNGGPTNGSVPVGVDGVANGDATSIGVRGTSTKGIGVFGSTASTAAGSGGTSLTGATGILGIATATSGGGYSAGVKGINNSTTSLGVGVYGAHAGSGYGVFASAPSGYGLFAQSTSGYGVYANSGSGTGLYGSSSSSYGVRGNSSSSYGVYGSGTVGVYGTSSGNGVRAESTGGVAVYATSSAAAGGGVLGRGYVGLQGETNGTANSQAIRGENKESTTGYAGVFTGEVLITGNLRVNGNLSKGSGSFRIDDPTDPANKYLSHSFVESPDMMNIYNGTITLNQKGEAVVTMPAYFSALNRDFRYQLTPIGAPGPNLYVARKISGNTWKIAGGKAGMEVSWQVTGVRNDPWAKDNRIPVQQLKAGAERGLYLYPAGYGKPQSLSMTRLVDLPKTPKPGAKLVPAKAGVKGAMVAPQALKTAAAKQSAAKPAAASQNVKDLQRVAQVR